VNILRENCLTVKEKSSFDIRRPPNPFRRRLNMKENKIPGFRKYSLQVIMTLILTTLVLPLRSLSAEEISLTVEDAVTRALNTDQRMKSSYQMLQSALLHIDETKQQRYPSLTLGASYTRLSHVSSAVNFGGASFNIESQDDVFSLNAGMGYALFDGFRKQKQENLARLEAKGQEISTSQMKQTVIFETRRAYWEAVRMQNNVSMLSENLSLSRQNRDITKNKFKEGTVLKADLLAAEMRSDQAKMDLEGAELRRDKAYLTLYALIETLRAGEAGDDDPTFKLLSDPSRSPLDTLPKDRELLKKALAYRPESLSTSNALKMKESSEDLIKSTLAPTLSVSGNYTYANPNSRVVLQSDPQFTGTWALGLSLSYDLGQIPSRLSAIASKEAEIESLKADKERQDEYITLDVKNCLLNYKQTEKDIALVTGMLSQARENERVTAQRVSSGTASDVDQLRASLARLQGEFAIVNKQIDLQIAAADLMRAAALDSVRE